jgi:hypothetical protein
VDRGAARGDRRRGGRGAGLAGQPVQLEGSNWLSSRRCCVYHATLLGARPPAISSGADLSSRHRPFSVLLEACT